MYFLPTGGEAETKVTTVQKNKPSQLVFLVPTLLPGTYNLEVRARMPNSTQLRTGQLDAVLTVVQPVAGPAIRLDRLNRRPAANYRVR